MFSITKYIALLSFLFLTFSCSTKKAEEKIVGQLQIVTTTGMIKDALLNITGDKAKVTALMGPGVDPHLYKATQGDLSKFLNADLVFYNGLHLEGKMGEIFEKLARQKPVVAAADGLSENELRKAPEFKDSHDPHIWFNVKLWSKAVQHMSNKLQEMDKENAEVYKTNTAKYILQLDSLDQWVRTEISSLPKSGRVLITAHDAFGYFGEAYSIEVKGLQGISTISDFGLNDISSLVNFINDRKIKAVFVESSVPKKSIEAVVEGCKQRGHEIKIGGTLYSDAMGAEGTFEGTYIGMVSSNVNKIVEGLK